MLRSLLTGSLTMQGAIMEILAVIMIIFLILPLHEMAHGFTAYKLGDNTAKNMGRLRFNPMAHVDPIGALLILFVGFGWAKPVPVNPRNFKNPKAGMAITALAGPLSNLLAAYVGAVLYYGVSILAIKGSWSESAWSMITIFFGYFISINVSLAVFNLIPIPPLDGSKILFAFLPDKIVYKAYQYEQILYMVLIVLIFAGVLTGPLSYLQSIMTDWILNFAYLPFKPFIGML